MSSAPSSNGQGALRLRMPSANAYRMAMPQSELEALKRQAGSRFKSSGTDGCSCDQVSFCFCFLCSSCYHANKCVHNGIHGLFCFARMARLLFCARPLTCFWPEESGTGVSLVCQVQSLLNKVCPENLALIVEKIAAVEACDVGSSFFLMPRALPTNRIRKRRRLRAASSWKPSSS